MRHTLTKLRPATVAQDGTAGVLYRHQWGTGFQELVFSDDAHAARWLKAQNDSQAVSEMASASYHPA